MASVTGNNTAIHSFKRFMDEEKITLKMHKKLLKENMMDKPISQKHLKQQKNLQDKHSHLS